jgi:hypothetical protein
MRMARMQLYLPDDLYALVKARRLRASELFQDAVRAEVRRQDLQSEADRYVSELVAEIGPPTAEQYARAHDVARRVARRPRRKAG